MDTPHGPIGYLENKQHLPQDPMHHFDLFLASLFQASSHGGPLSGWRRITKTSLWGGVWLEVGQIFTSRLNSWRAASAHTDGSSVLSFHFLPQAASSLSSRRVAVSSALGWEDPGLVERLSSYVKPEQRLLSSLLPIIEERSMVRIWVVGGAQRWVKQPALFSGCSNKPSSKE